jgi:hypothetical protein
VLTLFSIVGILSLPLEVLSMVCQNLDLPTVFYISRTSKAFYRFLRNSPVQMAIWDSARATSNLPTTTGYSSVQAANLLFGNCMVRSFSFAPGLAHSLPLPSHFSASHDAVAPPLLPCPYSQSCTQYNTDRSFPLPQGCGKPTAKVDYALRVRACKACSPQLCVFTPSLIIVQ